MILVCMFFITDYRPNCVQGSVTDSYHTEGKVNGRYWNTFTDSEKSSCIFGIELGIDLCADLELEYVKAGIDVRARTDMLKSLTSYLAPDNITLEETVRRINILYSDPKNLDIPLTTTYLKAIKEGTEK
jgi:hypothetical protein